MRDDAPLRVLVDNGRSDDVKPLNDPSAGTGIDIPEILIRRIRQVLVGRLAFKRVVLFTFVNKGWIVELQHDPPRRICLQQ